MERERRLWAQKLPPIIVVIFAFLYNFPCGLRWFDLFDTSIIFDGSYRMLCGQIPWRDFYAPFGPFLFGAQALIFSVMGPSYLAYVTFASILNAAITGIFLAYAHRLSRDRWFYLAAAMVTAIWSLPMHRGYPWYEHGAFLFVHLALWPLLTSSPRKNNIWPAVIAGLAIAGAYYVKQSVGAVGGLVLTLYLLQLDSWKRACWFIGGGALGFAALTGCWVALGGVDAVFRYTFLLPLTMGRHTGLIEPQMIPLWLAFAFAGRFFLKRNEWWLWIPTAFALAKCAVSRAISLYFFAPLLALAFTRRPRDRALLLSLSLIQYLAKLLSPNESYEFLMLIGAQLLICSEAAMIWLAAHREKIRQLIGLSDARFARASLLAVFLYALFVGIRYGLLRKITLAWLWVPVVGPAFGIAALLVGTACLLAFRDARKRAPRSGSAPPWLVGGAGILTIGVALFAFSQSLQVYRRKLSERHIDVSLRQPDLDLLKHLYMESAVAASLEDVTAYLRALPPEAKTFFVYPDPAVLYALLGQPPPQPFVWFHPQLTYRKGEPDEPRLCGALRRNGVRTVIVRSRDPDTTLSAIPCLAQWLDTTFSMETRFGDFHVYRFGKKDKVFVK
ncbi:MAG: hypothetical protein ABIJ96_07995 [Elusimicrobiota bacterium]